MAWGLLLCRPALVLGEHAESPPYVGREVCARCHRAAAQAWAGSHHDFAMQEATPGIVLGDFDDAEFTYAGVRTRFSRRGDRFIVNTDGPGGKLADFEIEYAFGADPLQQYLIELPGGRLQALSIAWDTRPREAGGQRWFHLYPGERITHEDELHWTKRSQNWNHMCAECHSTAFQKNYDPGTRVYASRWKEIDVSCEACHGPGSWHVAWAGKQAGWEGIEGKGLVVALNEREKAGWVIDAATGNARPSMPRESQAEIEMCARCHARRSQMFEDDPGDRALADSHLPTLLREGIYHADGQIDGEVYEYGSFLQSRMYHAGVTCSDCHDPHSLQLRASGDGVCSQCHAQGKYGATTHHFHRADSPGASCVGCHMAAKTYMVVDERHDHGFRVPRPDLSAELGTPNACAACHAAQTSVWAAEKVSGWLGRDARSFQSYGSELYAARTRTADAEAPLLALLRDRAQPAIARATTASALSEWLSPASLDAVTDALRDPSPLVRMGALEAVESLPPAERWQRTRSLLGDPVRVVRALTASVLAEVPAENLSVDERRAFERATDEYIASQRLNADQPESQVNMGNFLAARGDRNAAEAAYRLALKIDPQWVPAYVNLADLLRASGRDPEGENVLRAGLRRAPNAAALHHSLGLLLVRQKKPEAALESLRRAAELAPDDARVAYVYAVALDSAGKRREATAVVDASLARAPADRALRSLAASLAAPR